MYVIFQNGLGIIPFGNIVRKSANGFIGGSEVHPQK
jgi:hypothetical protein